MATLQVQDPPLARLLFSDTRFAWVWLVVRVWVGYEWLTAGWDKATSPAWMETGVALQRYWERAVTIPETGRPPIAFDWYRSFLEFLLANNTHVWFSQVIVFGQILVGVGLIVGALTGIAAFFGAVMNFNFMLAGTASTNPVMFAAAVLLMMAWKTAGWWGLDRWLLPVLGTPWQPAPMRSTLKGQTDKGAPPGVSPA